MLRQEKRIQTARAAVDYVTSRPSDQLVVAVPNCPGWTVYNAAVHICRASVFWEYMMAYPPTDTDARSKALRRVTELPTGVEPAELASWAHRALDQMATDDPTPVYFSMTGGAGTAALWAWHAASEIGIHRLDVEAALNHPHQITDAEALDSALYAAEYFMPALRVDASEDPGEVTMELLADTGGLVGSAVIGSASAHRVTMRGPSAQVLLAIWGRPHEHVVVSSGDPAVLEAWQALPGKVKQFGTWT